MAQTAPPMTPAPSLPQYLRPGQVAKSLGVSRNTVLNWCRWGWLPGAFQIGTLWHIPPESVAQGAELALERSRKKKAPRDAGPRRGLQPVKAAGGH